MNRFLAYKRACVPRRCGQLNIASGRCSAGCSRREIGVDVRILVEIDSSDSRTGAVNDMLDLCRYGTPHGHRFYLCGPIGKNLRETAVSVGFEVLGGQSRQIDRRNAVGYVLSVARWLWVLSRLKPQVVHLNYVSWGASLACAARILGIGIVSRSGGEYSSRNLSCRWTDRYVANCTAQAASLLSSPVRIKVRIAGDLINMERLAAPQLEPSSVPAGSPSTVRLLFLGQLVERKGIDVLVRAVSMLSVPVELFIVGGDWSQTGYPAQIKDLISQLRIASRIVLIDHQDGAISFLRSCDVFVLPSRSEARPRSIIEAMLLGKCVVSTDVGGIPSLVEHGVTGLLVAPGDPDALAGALHAVCSSAEKRATLGSNALAFARDAFDIEKTVRNYLDIYEEVVRGKNASDG